MEEERRPGPVRSYLALSGTADADPRLVRRLLSADWARRLLYNAAIDPRVPFAEGVTYRIERSAAERDGRNPPDPPRRSAAFLPVPRPFDLYKDFTHLRERYEDLRRWPVTMLRKLAPCQAPGQAAMAPSRMLRLGSGTRSSSVTSWTTPSP